MVANIDSFAYTGEMPWHREGVQVEGDLTPHEMMKAAKLDWTVSTYPMAALLPDPQEEGSYSEAVMHPNRVALMRDDKEAAFLGICSSDYKPIQNERIFDFFKKFSDYANISMETAGSLRDGRDIFGLAKLNDNFALPGGDELKGYVLFHQPHEPGYAMSIRDTEVRVVCSNTLQFALSKNATSQYRMSHRSVFDSVREEQALKTMGAVYERRKEFKEAAEFLSKTKAKHDNVVDFVAKLYNPKALEDYNPKEGPLVDFLNPTAKTVLEALESSPGADTKSAKGTWWGAVNAVTFLEDHLREGENKVYNAMFGNTSAAKNRALDLAITYAKAA